MLIDSSIPVIEEEDEKYFNNNLSPALSSSFETFTYNNRDKHEEKSKNKNKSKKNLKMTLDWLAPNNEKKLKNSKSGESSSRSIKSYNASTNEWVFNDENFDNRTSSSSTSHTKSVSMNSSNASLMTEFPMPPSYNNNPSGTVGDDSKSDLQSISSGSLFYDPHIRTYTPPIIPQQVPPPPPIPISSRPPHQQTSQNPSPLSTSPTTVYTREGLPIDLVTLVSLMQVQQSQQQHHQQHHQQMQYQQQLLNQQRQQQQLFNNNNCLNKLHKPHSTTSLHNDYDKRHWIIPVNVNDDKQIENNDKKFEKVKVYGRGGAGRNKK